jgi:hypothetical protein
MKHLLLLTALALAGCLPPASETPASALPIGAKVIKDLGHGWLVFETHGQQFIYCPHGTDSYADYRAAVLAPWTPTK